MLVEVVEEINAPQEMVFKLFTNFQDSQKIFHGAEEVQFVSDLKSGMGAEWNVVHETGDSYLYRVVEFAPNSHFVLSHEDESATEVLTFRFEPSGIATKVSYSVLTEPKGWKYRIASMLFKPMLRKMVAEDLDRLKTSIEQKTYTLPIALS